jgi:hypothetical protein
VFFFMIFRLKVNFNRLPDNFYGFWANILFVAYVAEMFRILVVFWVKINLM